MHLILYYNIIYKVQYNYTHSFLVSMHPPLKNCISVFCIQIADYGFQKNRASEAAMERIRAMASSEGL